MARPTYATPLAKVAWEGGYIVTADFNQPYDRNAIAGAIALSGDRLAVLGLRMYGPDLWTATGAEPFVDVFTVDSSGVPTRQARTVTTNGETEYYLPPQSSIDAYDGMTLNARQSAARVGSTDSFVNFTMEGSGEAQLGRLQLVSIDAAGAATVTDQLSLTTTGNLQDALGVYPMGETDFLLHGRSWQNEGMIAQARVVNGVLELVTDFQYPQPGDMWAEFAPQHFTALPDGRMFVNGSGPAYLLIEPVTLQVTAYQYGTGVEGEYYVAGPCTALPDGRVLVEDIFETSQLFWYANARVALIDPGVTGEVLPSTQWPEAVDHPPTQAEYDAGTYRSYWIPEAEGWVRWPDVDKIITGGPGSESDRRWMVPGPGSTVFLVAGIDPSYYESAEEDYQSTFGVWQYDYSSDTLYEPFIFKTPVGFMDSECNGPNSQAPSGWAKWPRRTTDRLGVTVLDSGRLLVWSDEYFSYQDTST